MASSPASAAVPQVFLDPKEEEFLYDFASFQLNSGAADSEDEDDLVGHDKEHAQEITDHMEESLADLFGQGDHVQSSADPNPDETGISHLQGAPPGWMPPVPPLHLIPTSHQRQTRENPSS
jgi:hypothetical protein